MVEHLHPEFWQDRERYEAAVSYWRTLCQEILREKGQLDSWQPFFGDHQKEGTAPVEEGSLWSLHSPEQHKAINIEQFMPNLGRAPISAMIDDFGEGFPEYPEFPIDVLTIYCVLSEESAQIARRLINTWVDKETTVAGMWGLIKQMNISHWREPNENDLRGYE